MSLNSSNIHASKLLGNIIQKKESMFSFYLVLFYLFLEYVRPQGMVPFIGALHLPAITILLIAANLLMTGKMHLGDKQTILFLLFIGEMVIHGPIALNNYYAYSKFYGMCISFLAFMGIINIIDVEFKYYKTIRFWIIIYIILAIIGIMQKGYGVGGFLGDENDFCMALNMIVPFGIFGIISAEKSTERIYFIIITCCYLLSILNYSRGGFIGLVAVIIYCWLRTNNKIKYLLMIGILILIALIAAPSSYWDRVRTISTEYTENVEGTSKGTGAQRIYAWKIGWRIFLENPVIGVGQGNYAWHVKKAEDEMEVQWKERSLAGREAHSLYFTLLPELGLVGTIIFLLFIIYSMKDLIYINKTVRFRTDIYSKEESKKIYYLGLALEGSLVGFLTSSIFISTLYYPNLWILLGFIVSLKKIVYAKAGNLNLRPNKLSFQNS
jgi:hypothetical protein